MLKPTPTITADNSSQRSRPVSAARSTAQAPTSKVRARVLSMVMLRLVTMLIGLSARARAASKPAHHPKVPLYQVIEQEHRQHTGQRLGHQHAEGAEAEEFGTGHLKPEAQRRLVDRHEATWIIGSKKEIIPVVHHASHCGRIIRAEAVLPQLEEVHEDRNESDSSQHQVMPGRKTLLYPLLYWMLRISLGDCR